MNAWAALRTRPKELNFSAPPPIWPKSFTASPYSAFHPAGGEIPVEPDVVQMNAPSKTCPDRPDCMPNPAICPVLLIAVARTSSIRTQG